MDKHRTLTLAEAIREGRLQDFIAQQELAYREGSDERRFAQTLKSALTSQQSEQQTSHSKSSGDLRGKQTR
jgi:hypothetical protein